MKKVTIRNKTFEGKLHDSDFSKTIRELDTAKKVNDIFAEFSDYDEDTTYNIYEGENLVFTITVHDFRVLENAVNENAVEKLSANEMQQLAKLYVLGMRLCRTGYEVNENLIELQEKIIVKDGEKIVKKLPNVILENRVVNINL